MPARYPENGAWYMHEVHRWGSDVRRKNMSYSMGNHNSMASDDVRCGAFAAAIARAATGRRVLDIGTGPYLLLARLCERAGAAFVACVEDSATSVQLAAELLKREQCLTHPASGWALDGELDEECREHLRTVENTVGALLRLRTLQFRCVPAPAGTPAMLASTSDDAMVLALYDGLSTDTALPGGIDLVVHEILGHMCSAEGVVRAVRELRHRPGLLERGCTFIPRAAGTMLAPTSALQPSQLQRLERRGRPGCGEQHGAAPAPLSLQQVDAFPAENLLAAAQPMEWYDFDAEEGDLDAALPEQQQRTLTFTTAVGASFDGVRLHLLALLDAETSIDSSAAPTTWSCLYVRLLSASDAVWLPAGSTIECRCRVDARGESPCYAIDVDVAPPGEPLAPVASYSWSGDG